MRKQIFNTVIISLLTLLAVVSCIPQKDLYEGGGTGTGGGGVNPPYNSSVYIYPYGDEVQGVKAEVTIRTKEVIHLDKIFLEIPHLKYNKSWLLLFTQDDFEHSTYCRTWAAINGRPISSSDPQSDPSAGDPNRKTQLYYDALQLKTGDLPPGVIPATATLGSTDGIRNEVRFAITATLDPECSWMNAKTDINPGYTKDFYRFYKKTGLVWHNVIEMLSHGTGIAFHNVSASNEQDGADILTHYGIGQDSIHKRLSGRGCKMLARPDGNNTYIEAALQYPDIQTMAIEGGPFLYPFKITDDLKNVLLSREFKDSPEYFKEKIEMESQLPKEERQAIMIGVHGTDNSWVEFLQWISNTYGKSGDDSVWFPSQEEYYEYVYYRNHATTAVEQIDDHTIKLIINLPGGEFFYYPSITLNVQGVDMQGISVTSNDAVTGLSYGKYGDDGIMLNLDCRKHLLKHATHFVEQYEKDKLEYYKADAIYFVNMLKDSPEKMNLLERIK